VAAQLALPCEVRHSSSSACENSCTGKQQNKIPNTAMEGLVVMPVVRRTPRPQIFHPAIATTSTPSSSEPAYSVVGGLSDHPSRAQECATSSWNGAPRSVAPGTSSGTREPRPRTSTGSTSTSAFDTHIRSADWDSATNTWTAHADDAAETPTTYCARFVFFGTGYYDYDEG
jgi:hypothetical protein